MSLGDKEKVARFMGHSICQQVKYMHVVKQDEAKAVDLHGVAEQRENKEDVGSVEELKKKHEEELAKMIEDKNKEYEEKVKRIKGQTSRAASHE